MSDSKCQIPNNYFCWNELLTNDVEAEKRFYAQTFGWTAETKDMGGKDYTLFKQDGKDIAGMMEIAPEWGDVPPHWLSYVQVQDVAQTLAKATSAGATPLQEPLDVGIGILATFKDPQGTVIGIWKPKANTCEIG